MFRPRAQCLTAVSEHRLPATVDVKCPASAAEYRAVHCTSFRHLVRRTRWLDSTFRASDDELNARPTPTADAKRFGESPAKSSEIVAESRRDWGCLRNSRRVLRTIPQRARRSAAGRPLRYLGSFSAPVSCTVGVRPLNDACPRRISSSDNARIRTASWPAWNPIEFSASIKSSRNCPRR
jgi:hypothetical protein